MTPSSLRLVIVDDDPRLTSVVAMMARQALTTDHVHIETATSVEAAEAAIDSLARASDAHAVVISDYHLPPSARTGLDLLDRVRERLPRAKRVLMTGRERSELEPSLSGAQLDAFLAKPFSFPELQPLLERFDHELRGERRVPIEAAPGEARPNTT